MKVYYYIEQYKGKWLVRSKIGAEIYGSHHTKDKALEHASFLTELKQPKMKEVA